MRHEDLMRTPSRLTPTPSIMEGGDEALPPLRDAIRTIKRLAYNPSGGGGQQRADRFHACVALLCHLRTDRAQLLNCNNTGQVKSDNSSSGAPSSPQLVDLPAISAVLQDGELYRILLGMLSSKPPINPHSMHRVARAISDGSVEPQTPRALIQKSAPKKQLQKKVPSAALQEGEGRKRSASVSSLSHSDVITPKTKKAKPALSPTSSKMLATTPPVMNSSPHLAVGDDFDAPVYAATVLYTAFSHLDHWPADLVTAYGEDCFGPRIWVDDEACSLLVQNLALTHCPDSNAEADKVDTSVLNDAQRYSDYYTYLINSVASDDKDSSNEKPSSSSGSDSGEEEECLLEIATVTAEATIAGQSHSLHKSQDAGNTLDDGASSSSGDESGEEEVLVDESVAHSDAASAPEVMALAALSHYQGIGGVKEAHATSPPLTSEKNMKSNRQLLSKEVLNGGSAFPSGPSLDDVDDASMADATSAVSSVPPVATHVNADAPTSPVSFPSQENSPLDLNPVRRRYFGPNLTLSQEAISDALSKRLGAKVKQNSRLLSTLPAFISVPRVRTLSACHLERWLQSPAISGLARPLFVELVQALRHIEPPLKEDIAAIDFILAMKLKANQLNTHIENIKIICRTVPTLSVSRHIFLQLLRQEYGELDRRPTSAQVAPSGMTFLVPVYETLPSGIALDALASAFYDIVEECSSSEGKDLPFGEASSRVQRVITLVRTAASALGAWYDGNQLVKSLLEIKHREGRIITRSQADALARVSFECMVLMAPLSNDFDGNSSYHRRNSSKQRQPSSLVGGRSASTVNGDQLERAKLDKFKIASSSAREAALRWCLSVYAHVVGANQQVSIEKGPNERREKGAGEKVVAGAGTPDYRSVLDGDSPHDQCAGLSVASQSLLKVVRCLLFLPRPESAELSSFLNLSDTTNTMGGEQAAQIRICCDYGIDTDESVMKLVLDAAKGPSPAITKLTALTLMEHLFLSCTSGRSASIAVKDADKVWELYDLAVYRPATQDSPTQSSSSSSDSDVSEDEGNGNRMRKRKASPMLGDEGPSILVPTLAYPGLWWRVTSLALAICGTDCKGIGAELWKQSPTLRAIIKMVTSGRYRFPTVDCDASSRDEMRRGEADMREKESRITQLLFLPKSSLKSKRIKKDEDMYVPQGSRVSARQRAKRDRLLALQREKEAALALAEEQRRKKGLRAAKKSIMIWDPRGAARKPPRETVGLILSVGESFGLGKRFRLCEEPDFLLRAIGSTSRESIERAYDWLIPIISSHPKTINRLPSSASCFLLLRAYGTEGDKNKQLLELSAPLRQHVGSCISGDFGESQAISSADLLFHDMSDRNPDRRLCARRVLQEATSLMRPQEDDLDIPDENDLSWLLSLVHVKFASGIIDVAIKHISHSIAYERGGVLRSLLVALDSFMEFANNEPPSDKYHFGELLCELLSLRPHVCCDAMDRFGDLRNLALSVVTEAFQDCLSRARESHNNDDNDTDGNGSSSKVHAKLAIRRPSTGDAAGATKLVRVPYHVLRACLVLIGNWPEQDSIDLSDVAISDSAALSNANKACAYLAQCLIVPPLLKGTGMQLPGAAGAVFANGKRAVSVEQWVMLAKSRCNQIAKLSALSAPDIFLPRLLLCCGISSLSLLSMIERLGDMGCASPDRNKYYTQLLSPSAVSEWGSAYQSGGRRTVARKLIGRLSAYLQINGEDIKQVGNGKKPSPFLSWLSEYCNFEMSKKSRVKSTTRSRPPLPDHLKQLPFNGALSQLLEDAAEEDEDGGTYESASMSVEASIPAQFSTARKEHEASSSRCNGLLAAEAIKSSIGSNDVEPLGCMAISVAQAIEDCPNSVNSAPNQAAMNLLGELSITDTSRPPVLVNAALKWLPFLSSISWDDSLFETAFGSNSTDTALRGMIEQCAKCWNEEQIRGCQAWILNRTQSDNGISRFSPQGMIDFLVRTSNQSPAMRQPFAGEALLPPFSVVSLHEHAAAAVKLALEGARIENAASTAPDESTCTAGSYLGRDIVPNWLVLLQLVARCSKKHLALVANSLISELKTDGWEREFYPPVLLRLYLSLPSMMNLGDPKLRGVLIEAAGDESLKWLDFFCPLDEQIELMIATLSSNWNQRLLQSMVDMSKRQPLVLLRHLGGIATVLIQDGDASSGPLTNTSRVRTTAAQGIAVAKTRRGLIKVTVSHWGYSFNEPLYSSVCEIITSLPTEVAFSCGLNGLLDIFETFVKLIWTQHSLGCPDHTVRIRTRLASLLATFNSFDPLAWSEWMESRLQGLEKCGPVREIVQLCEIKVHV